MTRRWHWGHNGAVPGVPCPPAKKTPNPEFEFVNKYFTPKPDPRAARRNHPSFTKGRAREAEDTKNGGSTDKQGELDQFVILAGISDYAEVENVAKGVEVVSGVFFHCVCFFLD